MCKGFIRIPRRLLEMKWWNRKRVLSENEAVVNLYQRADRQGAIATSIRSLAVEWGWEQTKVFRFLTKLEKDKFISSTKLRNGTVIKILDFGEGATQSTTQSATPKATETKAFHDECAPPSATQSAIPRANKNDNFNIMSYKTKEDRIISPNVEIITHTQRSACEAFHEWLNKECPYIATHYKLLTEEEFEKLKMSYGSQAIAEQCSNIENRKDLRKKYTNLYRTLLNWLKRNNHATTQTNQQPYHDSDHPTTEQLRQQTAAYIASRLAQD